MRRELPWKQSFKVTYLTKCWQPEQMLESLSYGAQGHMNPRKRNSDPVKVKGRTSGSQPWPCTHLHCVLLGPGSYL